MNKPPNSPFWDSQQVIQSRQLSEGGRENFDKIFRKGEETIKEMDEQRAKCPSCDGKGHHVERDTEPNGYGGTKKVAYQVPCEDCDGTGRKGDRTS